MPLQENQLSADLSSGLGHSRQLYLHKQHFEYVYSAFRCYDYFRILEKFLDCFDGNLGFPTVPSVSHQVFWCTKLVGSATFKEDGFTVFVILPRLGNIGTSEADLGIRTAVDKRVFGEVSYDDLYRLAAYWAEVVIH